MRSSPLRCKITKNLAQYQIKCEVFFYAVTAPSGVHFCRLVSGDAVSVTGSSIPLNWRLFTLICFYADCSFHNHHHLFTGLQWGLLRPWGLAPPQTCEQMMIWVSLFALRQGYTDSSNARGAQIDRRRGSCRTSPHRPNRSSGCRRCTGSSRRASKHSSGPKSRGCTTRHPNGRPQQEGISCRRSDQ